MTSSTANVSLRPTAVDHPPYAPRILVLQTSGQTCGPDVVVALQFGKTMNRRGQADRGKAGMAGGWERAAVIHGAGNRYAGWHFIVEQSAHALAERRSNPRIVSVVAASRVAVNAAGEIALQMLQHLQ